MALADNTQNQAASADVNAGVTADVEPAVAAATGLRLVGFMARETDGTPDVATGRIMNGATVAGGSEILGFELAANESQFFWFWPGIAAENGLSIDHIAGTFDIVLYHATVV